MAKKPKNGPVEKLPAELRGSAQVHAGHFAIFCKSIMTATRTAAYATQNDMTKGCLDGVYFCRLHQVDLDSTYEGVR